MNGDKLIAQKKGWNGYKKTDVSRCTCTNVAGTAQNTTDTMEAYLTGDFKFMPSK